MRQITHSLTPSLPYSLVMAESTVLTEDMILAKSGKKKPADVIKVNAFAMGVERITSLKSFVSLEVVSLSLNKMTSLQVFADCHALKELHLRKNSISDVEELKHLSQLTELHTLLLSDNPCTKVEGYRSTAIRMLKSLRKLDALQVTEQEKLARVEEEKEPSTNAAATTTPDDNFATCIIDTETQGIASVVSSTGNSPQNSSHYSNTLLATKLLLSTMNESEVQQLQIWCAKELLERKKIAL